MPSATTPSPTPVPTPTDPAPAKSWLETLPEAMRGEKSLADIPDVPALAKRFIDTKAMVGADKIVVPGKDAPPEQWNEYWTKLGRPEKPDQYELPKEGLPEGIAFPQEEISDYFNIAHQIGLSKQQAAALYRWQIERVAKSGEGLAESANQERQQSIADLKKEYGTAYDKRMALAQKALVRFGGQEYVDYLNATGEGDNPLNIKAWMMAGMALAGDEILGTGGGTSFGKSPGEAKAEIANRDSDPEKRKAYYDPYHPNHRAEVDIRKALYQAAYPEGQPA